MRFDRITDQGKVTHDIEQLVPGRFVREAELQVVEVSFAFDFDAVLAEGFGQAAHFLLCHGLVYHHNGIVDVSALDQVVIQQCFQFMQETERAAGCDLGFEIPDRLKPGVLGAEDGAVEIDQGGHLVFGGRHGH